jgi:hypothetical protein
MRGNIDNNVEQSIDIADLIYLVTYMFQDGPELPCFEEADVNADTQIDIATLIYLVTYMFQEGPPPLDCPPVVPDTVIFPLTIGNEWLSSYTEYNTSGGIIDAGTSATRVVGDSTVNDWLWHIVVDSMTGGGRSLWTNREDGLWWYTDTSAVQEALVLKYPANTNDTYPYYDLTVRVASTNAIVTVPAGQFTCYYYELDAPIVGTIGKIWAAPNIGLVKAEQYNLNIIWLYLQMRVELESYQLVE